MMHERPAPGTMPRDTQAALLRLEMIARVMDTAFPIPGTDRRVGFDSIIGLLPVIGDAISGMISSYLIWEARKLGVSKLILGRMMANTAIDTAIGSVPFIGDLFDVAYKANSKNVALLRAHLHRTHGVPIARAA